MITNIPGRYDNKCPYCHSDAAIRATLKMEGGNVYERDLCWACLKKVFTSLDMIETFLPKPITSQLLAEGGGPEDEDIPF